MAAAKTWIAEFLSAAMSSGESRSGSIFSFVYVMISDLPNAVLAAACGGVVWQQGTQGFLESQPGSWASPLL